MCYQGHPSMLLRAPTHATKGAHSVTTRTLMLPRAHTCYCTHPHVTKDTQLCYQVHPPRLLRAPPALQRTPTHATKKGTHMLPRLSTQVVKGTHLCYQGHQPCYQRYLSRLHRTSTCYQGHQPMLPRVPTMLPRSPTHVTMERKLLLHF